MRRVVLLLTLLLFSNSFAVLTDWRPLGSPPTAGTCTDGDLSAHCCGTNTWFSYTPRFVHQEIKLNQGSLIKPLRVTPVHLDSDGRVDFIISSKNLELHLETIVSLKNRGDGTFQKRVVSNYDGHGGLQVDDVADTNQDGIVDSLLISDFYVYLTQGPPFNLGAGNKVPGVLHGPDFRSHIADFDNNGFADILVYRKDYGGWLASEFVLYLADSGSYVPKQIDFLSEGFGHVIEATVANVTGDGFLDIVGATWDSTDGVARFYVWVHNGVITTSGLGFNRVFVGERTGWPGALTVVADIDGLGWLDIVTISNMYHFNEPANLWIHNGVSYTRSDLGNYYDFAAGDIDRDGDTDLVGISTDHTLDIFLNDGSGSFIKKVNSMAGYNNPFNDNFYLDFDGADVFYLDLADVDGDLDLDIITIEGTYHPKVFLWINEPSSLSLGGVGGPCCGDDGVNDDFYTSVSGVNSYCLNGAVVTAQQYIDYAYREQDPKSYEIADNYCYTSYVGHGVPLQNINEDLDIDCCTSDTYCCTPGGLCGSCQWAGSFGVTSHNCCGDDDGSETGTVNERVNAAGWFEPGVICCNHALYYDDDASACACATVGGTWVGAGGERNCCDNGGFDGQGDYWLGDSGGACDNGVWYPAGVCNFASDCYTNTRCPYRNNYADNICCYQDTNIEYSCTNHQCVESSAYCSMDKCDAECCQGGSLDHTCCADEIVLPNSAYYYDVSGWDTYIQQFGSQSGFKHGSSYCSAEDGHIAYDYRSMSRSFTVYNGQLYYDNKDGRNTYRICDNCVSSAIRENDNSDQPPTYYGLMYSSLYNSTGLTSDLGSGECRDLGDPDPCAWCRFWCLTLYKPNQCIGVSDRNTRNQCVRYQYVPCITDRHAEDIRAVMSGSLADGRCVKSGVSATTESVLSPTCTPTYLDSSNPSGPFTPNPSSILTYEAEVELDGDHCDTDYLTKTICGFKKVTLPIPGGVDREYCQSDPTYYNYLYGCTTCELTACEFYNLYRDCIKGTYTVTPCEYDCAYTSTPKTVYKQTKYAIGTYGGKYYCARDWYGGNPASTCTGTAFSQSCTCSASSEKTAIDGDPDCGTYRGYYYHNCRNELRFVEYQWGWYDNYQKGSCYYDYQGSCGGCIKRPDDCPTGYSCTYSDFCKTVCQKRICPLVTCSQGCDTANGYQCYAGYCRLYAPVFCVNDAGCASGYICSSNFCTKYENVACTADSQCSSGYKCIDGKCRDCDTTYKTCYKTCYEYQNCKDVALYARGDHAGTLLDNTYDVDARYTIRLEWVHRNTHYQSASPNYGVIINYPGLNYPDEWSPIYESI